MLRLKNQRRRHIQGEHFRVVVTRAVVLLCVLGCCTEGEGRFKLFALGCVLAFCFPTISINLGFFASYVASNDPFNWYWSYEWTNPGMWFFAYETLLLSSMAIYGFYLVYKTRYLKVYSVYGVRREFIWGYAGVGSTLFVYGLTCFRAYMKTGSSYNVEDASISRLYLSVVTVRQQ